MGILLKMEHVRLSASYSQETYSLLQDYSCEVEVSQPFPCKLMCHTQYILHKVGGLATSLSNKKAEGPMAQLSAW